WMWFLPGPVVRALFSPAGQAVAVLGEDGDVRVLDLADPGGTRTLCHPGSVQCFAFRRDGRRLLTGGDDGTARAWDPATGDEVPPHFPHGQWVTHASFSDDGRLVVTGGMDG